MVERSKGSDDEQLVVMMRVMERVHIQHHDGRTLMPCRRKPRNRGVTASFVSVAKSVDIPDGSAGLA